MLVRAKEKFTEPEQIEHRFSNCFNSRGYHFIGQHCWYLP